MQVQNRLSAPPPTIAPISSLLVPYCMTCYTQYRSGADADSTLNSLQPVFTMMFVECASGRSSLFQATVMIRRYRWNATFGRRRSK